MWILFAAFGYTAASAAPCAWDENLAHLSDLAIKVAEIDEPDRRTEEEFVNEHPEYSAAQVKAAMSPTGKFVCGGGSGSATLVLAKNVILTAGHNLQDRKSCAWRSKPEECLFYAPGRSSPYRVKSLVELGYDCPARVSRLDDWAVLKLDEEVSGVEPYAVAADASSRVAWNRPVVAVQNSNHDFYRRDRRGNFIQPRSIGECATRHGFTAVTGGPAAVVQTNCDGGKGGSGGALLDPDLKKPTLLAITIGVAETEEQVELARAARTPFTGSYDKQGWYLSHRVLEGAVLSAIQRAVSE